MTTPVSSTPANGTSGTVQPAADVKKLKAVAQQFEAVFLRQMIGSMRSASLGDGIFDSSATQQFRDMGDAKLADQMAGHGALHIADLLVKQLGARMHPSATASSSASAYPSTPAPSSTPAQASVQTAGAAPLVPASAGTDGWTGSDTQ